MLDFGKYFFLLYLSRYFNSHNILHFIILHIKYQCPVILGFLISIWRVDEWFFPQENSLALLE